MAAVLSANVFAQSDETAVYSNGTFEFDILEHWGYGYHNIKTDDFTPASTSGEIFVNMLKLKLYPTSFLGLELSADLKFDNYYSKDEGFKLEGGKVQVFDLTETFGNDIKRARGRMHVNSLSFPAIFKIGGQMFKIGAGAEAVYNYSASAKYRFNNSEGKVKNKDKGVEVNRFSYDFIGMITIDDVSIYAKYYPKGPAIFSESTGLDMSYWTVGVGFDF